MKQRIKRGLSYLNKEYAFYSCLPLIRMGFHANIAVFEDQLNGNIVVVAACDLKRGEYLMKPIDFFKKLKANKDFDIHFWRRKTEIHLNDGDKEMMQLLWNEFVSAQQWRQSLVHGDTEKLIMILNFSHYQTLRMSVYQSSLAQEIMFPAPFLMEAKAGEHKQVLHVIYLTMDVIARMNDTYYAQQALVNPEIYTVVFHP